MRNWQKILYQCHSVTIRVKLILTPCETTLGDEVRSMEELLQLLIFLFILLLFLQVHWAHLMSCWWLQTCPYGFAENIVHRDCNNYWKNNKKLKYILLSQGTLKSNQLVSTRSCTWRGINLFHQVMCLLISYISYNIRSVDPGIVGGVFCDTRLLVEWISN